MEPLRRGRRQCGRRRGGTVTLPRDPHRAVDDEIAHHIAECEDMLRARGWDATDARAEAERRFGDRERIREDLVTETARRTLVATWSERLQNARSAIRYTARSLRRNPGFTVATVVTLGMGIGTAAAAFAVVDALILRPIPYPDPDRWVAVHQTRGEGGHVHGLAAEQYEVLREGNGGVLRDWVAFMPTTVVRTSGEASALAAVAVTHGAERALGISLLIGRGFTDEDAHPGVPPVAILTRKYWEEQGSDPDVIGTEIRLESGPVSVVGVLRERTRFPTMAGERDLWLPLRSDLSWADRPATGVEAWAKLTEAVTLPVASEIVNAATPELPAAGGLEGSVWTAYLEPLGAHRGSPERSRAVWIVLCLTGFIFLIAAANALSLALVRQTARASEMAVRRAIGGARGTVMRHLGLEGMALGLVSGTAGICIAWLTLRLIAPILPSSALSSSPHGIGLEARTSGFALVLCLSAGAILAVAPAIVSQGRGSLHRYLSGRVRDETRRDRRLRNGLVAGQVALSMTLIAVAGLLLTSLVRLVRVDPGMEVERLATAWVIPSPTRYPDPEAKLAFLNALEEALEAHPSISGASFTTGSGYYVFDVALEAEGRPVRSDQPETVPYTRASTDFFRVVGMPVIEGRPLEAPDGDRGNVLVNDALARFLWGRESPLGRRFRVDAEDEWMTVVGVVPELRLEGRDERSGPYQIVQGQRTGESGSLGVFHLRTPDDPSALLPVVRTVLRDLDPEQWIWKLQTAEDALAEEEGQARFLVKVMTALAAIALTLAAVGLFGVLSYSVSRRRRELGVRMALGADRNRLRRDVLTEGLKVTLIGVLLGAALALAGSRLFGSLLYDVSPTDPGTLVAAAALMLGVAAAASTLPARRATSVNPVDVLAED